MKVQKVWDLTEETWKKITKEKWIAPSIGIIGGIGAITFRDNKGSIKSNKGTLYKILISETIWMIWKTRNLRIFEGKMTSIKTIEKMDKIKVKKW